MLIWPPSKHYPRIRFSSSLKFRQQEWPDLGLEEVDQAAEHYAPEIFRKMVDKVRPKAAVEEKKKDDDLKEKERGVQKTRG